MKLLNSELLIVSVCLSAMCNLVYAVTDPTRPYNFVEIPEFIEVEVPEESTDWQLSGIRIHGDKRSAILNGRMIREGEILENATVLKIQPTSVVLESGDKHLVVKMHEIKVKQPSKKSTSDSQAN